MAAPSSVSVLDITGTFVMNKKLSDSSITVLKMQKIPWIVQQAVNYSTITVKLRQYTDEQGVVHVDQQQLSTGTTQQEDRSLTGIEGERDVQFWGKVKGKNNFKKIAELEDDFLKEGWLDEADGQVIWSYVESQTDTWTAEQVWGFAEVQGERRHVRRIVAKKGSQVEKIRLVYDFQSTP